MASSPILTKPNDIGEPARQRFQLNLDALAARDPDLANTLAKTKLPSGAEITPGRDGTPVAIVERDETTVRWLGGTSMPSVSVPEVLCEPFDPNHSVALPAVGSGYEALWLADRLHPHAAVFVCEPDPAPFALAMHAVDLSKHLRSGQIAPIIGDTEASLIAFFERNPGYQPPMRVQKLPHINASDFATRVAAIQRGAQFADSAQQQLLTRLTQQVKRSRTRRSSAKPRVLILSTDAVGGALEFAAHAASSVSAAGIDAPRCLPDAPDKCQRSARLAALRDHDPDWVLLINGTPGPLRECWPDDLPYVCWFLESAQLPANALTGLRECPDIRAASTTVRDRLVAAGANAKNVHVLEPGVDDTAFYPLKKDDLPDALACDVAVFAEGFDLSPQASNIGLETHQTLWTKAASTFATSLREGRALDADALLTRAEKATRIQLADDEMRKSFRDLLAARVIPTVTARLAVTELAAIARTRLWGSGWQAHHDLRALIAGDAPLPIQRNRIYQSAKFVVFPQRGPAAVRGMLEVLAAGGCPIGPRLGKSQLSAYPQSGGILAQIPSYPSLRELSQLVESLRTEMAKVRERAASMRAQLVQSHVLRDRLASLHQKFTARLS